MHTYQAALLGAPDKAKASFLLAVTRLTDGRRFELAAHRSQNRMVFFSNFSWLQSRGSAVVNWAFGPSREKLIRTSCAAGWSHSGTASIGVEVTMAAANVVRVDGAVDRGSPTRPMTLSLAADMGEAWGIEVFNFSSSLSSSIYEVDLDRDRLLLVESPVEGSIIFSLWGFRFFDVELGLHESTFGRNVITKCIVRQGPWDFRLGSGKLELDTRKKDKLSLDFHVENAFRVRLFKLTTDVDRAGRKAECNILYGMYKIGLSSRWSDGFAPDPFRPGFSTLSVSLGAKVSIFTISAGCSLDRGPDRRISMSLANLTIMQKHVKWLDGAVDVDFAPNTSILPAPTGNFLYTKFESTVTLVNASSFDTQDFAAALTAILDIPQAPAAVAVDLHGAAVKAGFDLDEGHGEPKEVATVAELEVGLAIAQVCGVDLDAVAVSVPNQRRLGEDFVGIGPGRRLAAWYFGVTIAAGGLSDAVSIAKRVADVDGIERELRELVPPAPKLEATSPPVVVLKLSTVLRSEGEDSPPVPPSNQQLRFQLAEHLGVGAETVQLEIAEVTSMACHSGVCVEADPAEVETSLAPQYGRRWQGVVASACVAGAAFVGQQFLG